MDWRIKSESNENGYVFYVVKLLKKNKQTLDVYRKDIKKEKVFQRQ